MCPLHIVEQHWHHNNTIDCTAPGNDPWFSWVMCQQFLCVKANRDVKDLMYKIPVSHGGVNFLNGTVFPLLFVCLYATGYTGILFFLFLHNTPKI